MYHLRSFQPDDYDKLAAVRNLVMPEPVDGATMAEWDRSNLAIPSNILRRFLVVDKDDRVIGAGYAEHLEGMPEGRWALHALVHPQHRLQGVGRMLWAEGERIAREGGATELEAWVRGEDDDSYAWAQRRGYQLERQRTESILELSTWDPARFTAHLDRVAEGGITFLCCRDLPTNEELKRGLYAVDVATCTDVPAFDDEMVSYETWLTQMECERNPHYFAIALDGDQVIGYSMLVYPWVAGGSGGTGYTASLRSYRGRGIAFAVKLLTVMEAQRAGIPRMRTNNDPDNPAMLAINGKLGYQAIPGPRRMRKQL